MEIACALHRMVTEVRKFVPQGTLVLRLHSQSVKVRCCGIVSITDCIKSARIDHVLRRIPVPVHHRSRLQMIGSRPQSANVSADSICGSIVGFASYPFRAPLVRVPSCTKRRQQSQNNWYCHVRDPLHAIRLAPDAKIEVNGHRSPDALSLREALKRERRPGSRCRLSRGQHRASGGLTRPD